MLSTTAVAFLASPAHGAYGQVDIPHLPEERVGLSGQGVLIQMPDSASGEPATYVWTLDDSHGDRLYDKFVDKHISSQRVTDPQQRKL